MGLGGYLTWTAAAREIHQRLGQNIQILPIEMHGNLIRVVSSEVFLNNPRIAQNFVCSDVSFFPIVLNNPDANYCKSDTPQKATHRYDRHIIEQICEVYGIQNPELKCEIFLTDQEENIGKNLKNKIGNYIVLEPQTKDEYGVNKTYPFDKWQAVVNDLVTTGVKIVQVGRKSQDKKLLGVEDLTGTTTFREAASVIKYADLFISAEGGLMHAANAVGTKCLIIYSGFIHPKMTAYPENTNLWIGQAHGPCGMKELCEQCQKEMMSHNFQEIVYHTKRMLEIL